MELNLFSMVLALIGPPATQPAGREERHLQIKAGEQIVAIGDSITQAGGYLRAMEAVFGQQYPDLKTPAIVNKGIGGQKAEDLIKRFEQDVIRLKPAIVTISVGINDVWHRLAEPHDEAVLKRFAENVEKMVRMARDAGIRVYLLAPTIIEENAASEGNRRLAGYVAAGKEIARRHKCIYVDLHGLLLEALAQPVAQATSTRPAGRFTTDGVHMKPAGDVLMAVGLLRALGVPDEKMKATDLSKAVPGAK
jgi:lysophospholipase L1-like esterase